VRIWGHRGTRSFGDRADTPPENTLAAIRYALQAGAHGVEIDVRLCKSGEVVVLHDVDLMRVAGAPLRAHDATLTELQAHDLGQGERVPTLEDAIDLVIGGGYHLNVEIKADVPDEAALVDAVGKCVRARSSAEQTLFVISSFSPSICRASQRELPGVPIAFLYEHASDASKRPAGMEVVHPHHALLDAGVIAELHGRALTVNAWTVNDPVRAVELARAGVDGLITDHVTAIVAALSAA